jgi:hypothetical protein
MKRWVVASALVSIALAGVSAQKPKMEPGPENKNLEHLQ